MPNGTLSKPGGACALCTKITVRNNFRRRGRNRNNTEILDRSRKICYTFCMALGRARIQHTTVVCRMFNKPNGRSLLGLLTFAVAVGEGGTGGEGAA